MMPLNLVNARKCVQAFDFTRLIGSQSMNGHEQNRFVHLLAVRSWRGHPPQPNTRRP
jgi:hypothetical protein